MLRNGEREKKRINHSGTLGTLVFNFIMWEFVHMQLFHGLPFIAGWRVLGCSFIPYTSTGNADKDNFVVVARYKDDVLARVCTFASTVNVYVINIIVSWCYFSGELKMANKLRSYIILWMLHFIVWTATIFKPQGQVCYRWRVNIHSSVIHRHIQTKTSASKFWLFIFKCTKISYFQTCSSDDLYNLDIPENSSSKTFN